MSEMETKEMMRSLQEHDEMDIEEKEYFDHCRRRDMIKVLESLNLTVSVFGVEYPVIIKEQNEIN